MQFQEIKVVFLVFYVAETSVIVGLMDQRECVCCVKSVLSKWLFYINATLVLLLKLLVEKHRC